MRVPVESGYASEDSAHELFPQVFLTRQHLQHLNRSLNDLDALEIIRWCKISFPNLYQTTAFGLSGLVTLDMLSRLEKDNPLAPKTDVIFLDTLYHFPETHNLIERIRERYVNTHLHIYKPQDVNTTSDFEARYGQELWKTRPDLYDWVAKVEPAQRAYLDLSVSAVLTGRRRSQGAKRESLEVIEMDDTGLIKINPLASWSFAQVEEYIKSHNLPYNQLLDRGYKSVGDWHSTEPVQPNEDERSGRWKGQEKSECGIHNKRSNYAQFLAEAQEKQRQEELAAALSKIDEIIDDGCESITVGQQYQILEEY